MLLFLLAAMILSGLPLQTAYSENLSKAIARIKNQAASNVKGLQHAVEGSVGHAPGIEPVLGESVKSGVVYAVQPTPADDAIVVESLKAEILKKSAGTSITPFPGLIRIRTVDGDILDLKSFVVAGRPLVYDSKTTIYTASIKVGVSPISGIGRSRKLSAPLTFEVLDASDRIATVDSTSPPFVEMPLEFASAPNPSIVRVSSPTSPGGIDVPLSKAPSVLIVVQRPKIQGYGLETTLVTAFVQGVTDLKGHEVAFSTEPGAIEPATSVTDESGKAVANLRSESTGVTTVAAIVPGVGQGSASAEFLFPWLTLTVSVFGGLAGGLIRLLQGKVFKAGTFVVGLLVAVLIGAVVFALYAVGVNVLPISPNVTQGSVLVFVISAVGAYLGNLKFA